jgi:GNAT superfamily N-acetyltransferase
MQVREARADEIPALAAAVAQQPLLLRYGVEVGRFTRDLQAAAEAGQLLVVGDPAQGFAWYLPTGTFAMGGYLRLIALCPGQEGRGLGGVLLDEVERRVAPRPLFLLCSHWNQEARRFYLGRGYHEVGALTAFIRADTDEIVYWKRP